MTEKDTLRAIQLADRDGPDAAPTIECDEEDVPTLRMTRLELDLMLSIERVK